MLAAQISAPRFFALYFGFLIYFKQTIFYLGLACVKLGNSHIVGRCLAHHLGVDMLKLGFELFGF